MTKETQKELLAAAKKALAMISISKMMIDYKGAKLDVDFVFELRDLIRKCESEEQNGIHS
jgi:hypothetical protein